MPCPVPAIGIPGTPGVPAGPPSGAALKPSAGNALATDPVAGAAAAQLCGADNAPTKVARPKPADTALSPRPDPVASVGAGAGSVGAGTHGLPSGGPLPIS